ncbi:MAG: Mur ligase family protein, partial [Negativibacillus sp.]|nr:Mur ligase family protein [Negativibacillus sp.]
MWKIQEAVDYIEQTRTPRERYGKEKLEQALEMLGNPQKKLKFVHVAGTNGKGSTASMLACILSEAGYRTGLYTSPHLVWYHERMQVDGEQISDEDLIRAAQKVQEVCAKLGNPPIVFEVLTLMALWYFAEKNCEIVVLEVGIGGRLDSTNVIDAPLAAVITQIGLDHTETLGNTIEQIAAEKGGIIKPGCEAVMAKQSPEAVQVVQELCRQ